MEYVPLEGTSSATFHKISWNYGNLCNSSQWGVLGNGLFWSFDFHF